MKLIHLSDLHLGKRLEVFSFLEDQEYILRQILRIIKEEEADAVLLCGDIYDKSVPSAEAVTLLDDFLNRLAGLQVQVYAISGNHDSPERLAFGGRLMEGAGIHLSPVYRGSVEPLQLQDRHGTVHFWLLPFLKPAHVKHYFPDEGIESYTDAVRVAIENMHVDHSGRNVLLTHQFVAGSATCDSEEHSVGGSDNVDASVFEGFDYVALGHIHGPQNIGSSRIRYCGTPLKYSFSEVDHYKSVTVVELEEKGQLKLRTVPLEPLHDMRQLRGSFDEIIRQAADQPTEDYLRVILTDEEDIPEGMAKLRAVYPNIVYLTYDNTRTAMDQTVGAACEVEKKSRLELFQELYEKTNNQPMSPQQQAYVQELIEAVWGDTQ